MTVRVTAANEQERAQVAALAREVQEATNQSVELVYVDQGYTGEQTEDEASDHGIHLHVVKLPGAMRGLPGWLVSDAWLATTNACRRR